MSDDPIMAEIAEALALLNSGRLAEARLRFSATWEEIAETGNDFQRCILAHYLADAQDDPAEELAWDRRALAAADQLMKDSAGSPDTSLGVLSFFPTLHLNLADVLHRTGDDPAARRHLDLASNSVDALADDDFGRLIRQGIDRLSRELPAAG